MIRRLANLNRVSVLLAFAVYFVRGAWWFTPFFSRRYKFSPDLENETLPDKPIFIMVITLASSVLFYALDILARGDALEFAAWVGAGFLAANTVNIAINPVNLRPLLFGAINGSRHVTGTLIVCMILNALQ